MVKKADLTNPIRVCFLGTPAFAADHLKTLLADSRFLICGVVTQPDRPAGRKMQLTPSAVKIVALENKLSVLTPESLKKDPQALQQIQNWRCDVAVVVAFGQILDQNFLDSFPYGAVNVHGSLLPLWRGAAPIQRSLQAGDKITGVSLQKMVLKLDAGPIIGERKIDVSIDMNATELFSAMSRCGCEMLKTDLVSYIQGAIQPQAQDESKVTVATKISKEESLLNFNQPALDLHNKIRAFSMGPGTYLVHNGQRLKIHKTQFKTENEQGARPGEISFIDSNSLYLQTQSGQLALLEVQPESKSKVKISDFLRNQNLKKGDRFADISSST